MKQAPENGMNGDDREYGVRSNQVHPFFSRKREWSKVKDKILGAYITCYLKTIHRRRRPIIIVDAFSGPGKFGDESDGSPVIICRAIDEAHKKTVGISCIFADAHPAHRVALQECLAGYISKEIAERPLSDFSGALSRALEVGSDSTLFFYLDPYGIKDLEFATLRQIYERDTSQSTEVFINFNFRTFMRMSGNWSYDATANEVALKVKESKTDTVNAVMGGDYWLDIVCDNGLDKVQREDAVVGAYMDRIRPYFKYTFSIPVKEIDETTSNIPPDNLAKYHLIFGTRSTRAVLYMNDVANIALEPYFNQFKDGLLFPVTPGRYEPAQKEIVKKAILKAVGERPLRRPDIYEKIAPIFFLQRRSKDYRAIIDELAFKENRLFPDPSTLKRKGFLNDKTLLSAKSWPAAKE